MMNSLSLARAAYFAVQTTQTELTLIRQKRGMSVKQLSELSGVSETMIRRIENGNIDARIGTLAKLAKCLEVRLSLSFEDFDKPSE